MFGIFNRKARRPFPPRIIEEIAERAITDGVIDMSFDRLIELNEKLRAKFLEKRYGAMIELEHLPGNEPQIVIRRAKLERAIAIANRRLSQLDEDKARFERMRERLTGKEIAP